MNGPTMPQPERPAVPCIAAAYRACNGDVRRAPGRLARMVQDRRGVTAIEYGIIAGAIMVALGVAFAPLGGQLATFYYERVTQTLADAAN